MTTVIEYLLKEIKSLGVRHVFGVPGDYAFPIDDAIEHDPELEWIGSCNELNASYSADGYARVNGFAALCTTFGVGELCTLGGLAGAYAEHLPVIHIVGMPASVVIKQKKIIHHTLGTGDFDIYRNMTRPAVAAEAFLTPENAVSEINRVIAKCVECHRPVYFCIPSDYVDAPVKEEIVKHDLTLKSDPETLRAAVDVIEKMLENSKKPVVLPGYLLDRLKLSESASKFISQNKLPYATMFMDKSTLDESLEEYIGMYDGDLMNTVVSQYVESSDCILVLGALWSDFNTGAFSATVRTEHTIHAGHHQVTIGRATYLNVEIRELIAAFLEKKLEFKYQHEEVPKLEAMKGIDAKSDDKITSKYLYKRLEQFVQPNDIIVADTGSMAFGMAFAHLPKGAKFFNQTLWGAIGWATPAAFGAAIAAPEKRVILMTGEGAFQLTAQEISEFTRFGLKPVLMILNNNGYLTERVLCKEPMIKYNDVPQWNYKLLPAALGMEDTLSNRVETVGEIESVLKITAESGKPSFIEIITDVMDAPELAQKLGANINSLYK